MTPKASLSILKTPYYISKLVETNKKLMAQALVVTPAYIFKARLYRFLLNSLVIILWMLGPSIYLMAMLHVGK
ncbi:MAG: hypothetical protein ACKO34_06025 [Vampirovibrionales bacterium]